MDVKSFSNALSEFASRIRFFFRGNAKADHAYLDEELRFHLDRSIQANIAAGMNPEQARRQAQIDFGGVEQAREETYRQRPGWLLETIGQDIRYALRGFRRNPAFAVTAVATLALAIGSTTAVFSVVDPILFRALPYVHGDQLVSVGLTAPIVPGEFMLGGSYYVWRDNQKPFTSLTSETGVSACDLTERNPAHLSCASVEASFLPTLGITPFLGRNFLPEEDRPNGPKAALISYGLWKSHYGADAGIVNRLIDIDGVPTRVIGVLPASFEMPTLEAADIVRPEAIDEAVQRKADGGMVMFAFARLKPGLTIEAAQAQLEPMFQYSLNLAPPAFRKEVHLRVRSLRDRQMHDVHVAAWILLGAVFAVLLIACGNVAGLMMARGAAREHEFAVRSALGASSGRLACQTLTEALLLSLAAAVLGSALAELLLRFFVAIAPTAVPFLDKARLDLRVAILTMLLACLCGITFGILAATKPRALAARSTNAVARARSGLTRKAMVVTQIAISMVLLSTSMLLVRSFLNLQNQNLGMATHAVLTASISLGAQRYDTAQKQVQFFTQSEAAVRRLPGINSVGVSDSLPPTGWHHDGIYSVMEVSGRPRSTDGTGGMVAWRWVTPDYFRALHISIVQGRNFTEAERNTNENLIILSRGLANRMFPGENPIGQRIKPQPFESFSTVVGIAADVKNAGLIDADEPEFYRLRPGVADNLPNRPGRSSILIVETSLPATTVAPWLRTQIANIDPTVPVEIETMSERVSKLADGPRFETALLTFFAFTGLAMAVIGLYGLTAYMTTRRTQEIGVRLALGATRMNIMRLVGREGIQLLLIGELIGLSVALALSQLMRSLLFNIAPRDPVTFVAVAALLAIVALLATFIPVRSAMRIDPVVALRSE